MAKRVTTKIDFSGTASAMRFRQEFIRREYPLPRWVFAGKPYPFHDLWKASLLVDREETTGGLIIGIFFKMDDYRSLPGTDAERNQVVRNAIAAVLTENWKPKNFTLTCEDGGVCLLQA